DYLGVPTRYDNRHGPRWASRQEIILVKDLVVDDDGARRDHEFVCRFTASISNAGTHAIPADRAFESLVLARRVLHLEHVTARRASRVALELTQHPAATIRCG